MAAISPTTLTGTLAAGLCPGSYPATVTDPQGLQATGGKLLVSGTHSLTVAGPVDAPAMALTGRDQQFQLALPDLQVVDTTCTTAGSVTVSVSVSTLVAGRRHDLTLPSITLATAGVAASVSASLVPTAGRAQTTLAVPAAKSGRATWHPSVTVLLPANAYAGPYTITLTIVEAS